MSPQQAAGFLSVSGKDRIDDGAMFREGCRQAVSYTQLQAAVGAQAPVQL
jgi:hypothetical protein